MIEGKTLAVVVPAFDEEGWSPRRSPASRTSSTGSSSSTTPPVTRPPSARARTGDPRVEVIIARAEPRRRRRDRNRLQAGARRAHGRHRRDGRRQPDGSRRARGDRRARSLRGEVDYAKANRLITGRAWELIPRSRYLGNAVLSLLTKIASGYWHVADSQAGYTAISLPRRSSGSISTAIYTRYGFPNDLLVHLNVINARVRDVPSRPIYEVGERSGIRHPQGRPAHLLAAPEGLLLAHAGEVRDPRLPPARLLLPPRVS